MKIRFYVCELKMNFSVTKARPLRIPIFSRIKPLRDLSCVIRVLCAINERDDMTYIKLRKEIKKGN